MLREAASNCHIVREIRFGAPVARNMRERLSFGLSGYPDPLPTAGIMIPQPPEERLGRIRRLSRRSSPDSAVAATRRALPEGKTGKVKEGSEEDRPAWGPCRRGLSLPVAAEAYRCRAGGWVWFSISSPACCRVE